MSQELPVVLVDGREPPERVALLEAEGIPCLYNRFFQMDFADYTWKSVKHGCSIGVQAKTWSETLNRFKNRELQRILRGLHMEFDIPIFLVGGFLGRTKDNFCDIRNRTVRVNYDAIQNYLNLSLPRDLPGMLVRPEPSSRDEGLMRSLATIVRYWEDDVHDATWLPVSQRAMFALNEDDLEGLGVLIPYPGVGEEMASRLLDAGLSPYEVFKDVMESDGEKTKAVHGMGPKRVEGFKKVLEYKRGTVL